MDRSEKYKVHKYKLGREPNDSSYWKTKTPEERLAALEQLRIITYGEDAIKKGMVKEINVIRLKDKK